MTKLEPTRTNSDLTATERLRELLDERGVEWAEGIARPELTQVRIDGKVVKFHPWQPNTLKVSLFDITPEQAIAATLGAGTCHITDNGPWGYPYVCSACGASFDPDVNGGDFNYCPNCGRRVEVDDG